MGLRWLALLGCFCALVTLGQSAAVRDVTTDTMVVARSEEEGTTASSTASGDEELATEGPTPPIKLGEMEVRSEVSLRYAHTSVVTKMRNPAGKAQEATFRVLLPETAFISGFVMILDGKPYKAYVKEKDEAKKIYTDAVSSGIGAAHIAAKARDSNHFTVSVNVEPRTTAVFNLTYEELLVRRNKVYNHAINLHPGALVPKLTVTVHIKEAQKITDLRVPEVRTGNEIDATEDDPQNSKAVIVRGHDDREATITFSPDLDEQKRLMEIYAEKTKESRSQSHSYWQPADAAGPEGVLGQFVVQYDVDRPKEGEILVNDGYFVHFFAPADLPPLHKHVVFVLDTSGSMMDRKIAQLREAMRTILAELNPGDYFSLVEFATSVKVYELKEADGEPSKEQQYGYYTFEEKPATLVPPAPATPENIARAKTIVGRLSASGGTNIAKALNTAMDLINKGIDWQPAPPTPAPSNDAPRAEPTTALPQPTTQVATDAPKKDDAKKLEPIIIFLTDGDPTVGETDTTRIINRLVEKNIGENKATIFSLAFGEDADRGFLRKLSLRNDGFMRHIYEAADAALQLRDFYRQVSSPLLAHVHFNYPKEQIKEGSLTKNRFRAYYAGSETVVAGRVADQASELAPSIVAVCGVDDAFIKRKKYELFPKVPVSHAAGQYLPLERVWAYLSVKQLLDQRDAADTPQDKNSEDTPEKKALQIALKYEFVTPLTSLVVVKPNATNAVNAESVDKQQNPSYATPLAAYSGSFGAPGLPSPQLAYSPVDIRVARPPARPALLYYQEEAADVEAALRSAIGYVASPQLASFMPAAAVPLLDETAYAESEDYDDPASDPAQESWESGPAQQQFMPRPVGTFMRRSGWSGWSSLSDWDYPSVDAFPSAVTSQPPLPPSTTPLIVELDSFHLQEFPWVRDAVLPGQGAIVLPAPNNASSSLQLELTRDAVAPKEAVDAECPRSTAGAAGVCVYLTRCHAAKTITLDQYKTSFCTVNAKFAGVCCPRDKVDVGTPKKV